MFNKWEKENNIVAVSHSNNDIKNNNFKSRTFLLFPYNASSIPSSPY